MILVVTVFVSASGALVYGGIHMIALHRSETVTATIVDCEPVSAGRTLSCKGNWTIDDPGGRRRRVVHGTVEDATVADIGKTMDIVVSGNRGWKNASALRLGIIALVFAALCLYLAIILPLDQRAQRRQLGKGK